MEYIVNWSIEVLVFEVNVFLELYSMNIVGVIWKVIIKNWINFKYYYYYCRLVFIIYFESLFFLFKVSIVVLVLYIICVFKE